MTAEQKKDSIDIGEKKRTIKGLTRYIIIGITAIAIIITLSQTFHFSLFGHVIPWWAYLYLVIALFLPIVFLTTPFNKRAPTDRIPWYDILAAILAFVAPFYFAIHCFTFEIALKAWELNIPSVEGKILAICLILLILDGGRRTVGLGFFLVSCFFAVYPLFASFLPGLLEGISFSWQRTIGFLVAGPESIVGIPMKVAGKLLIGYMLFAVTLMVSGGGRFFLNLALSLFGYVRGGAAKVAIIASAFMGSLSGSILTNVVTTGSITIPAMKKTGYPGYYAGAVESCASTGGAIMPPIMGAVAFIMADFLGVSYAKIIGIAILPSLLHYIALFIQADGYAAKMGIKGLPKSELPSFKETIKTGWVYIIPLFALIFFLVYMRLEGQAPFYATALLLVCAMINKETRLHLRHFLDLLQSTGNVIGVLVAILGSVGIVMGSLLTTGVASSLATDILHLAGDNIGLLLILGALTSFVLGMGVSISACYIILALVLAPALVNAGLNIFGVHLFMAYCGLLSNITPPVAMACYAAAAIAEAPPMKTAVHSMRLGIVLFIIPFYFALKPGLLLIGSPIDIITAVSVTTISIFAIAGAFEGYFIGIGKTNWFIRIIFIAGGVLGILPEFYTSIVGIGIIAVTYVLCLFWKKSRRSIVQVE